MDVPNVVRKDLQLIDIDGDFLSLMDDMGETRDDIKIPEGELGDEIKVRFVRSSNFSCRFQRRMKALYTAELVAYYRK